MQQDLEKGEVVITGKTVEGYKRHAIQRGTIPPHIERLSLGSHKWLDWEMVKRRGDLCDILPVWFRLGQMVPRDGKMNFPSDFDKLDVVPFLEMVFHAYFSGILVPRLFDEDHQGIFLEGKPIATAPLALLFGRRWMDPFALFPKRFSVFTPSSSSVPRGQAHPPSHKRRRRDRSRVV